MTGFRARPEDVMRDMKSRLMVWSAAIVAVLLVPFLLTILGSGVDGQGVNWTLGDAAIMAGLMFGAAVAYELLVRRVGAEHRVAVGVVVATGLVLIWIAGAVVI